MQLVSTVTDSQSALRQEHTDSTNKIVVVQPHPVGFGRLPEGLWPAGSSEIPLQDVCRDDKRWIIQLWSNGQGNH